MIRIRTPGLGPPGKHIEAAWGGEAGREVRAPGSLRKGLVDEGAGDQAGRNLTGPGCAQGCMFCN